MSNIVCKKSECPYRSQSGFCTESFVMINAVGGCMKYWTPQGQYVGWRDYADPAETEPTGDIEVPPPKNSEG